MHSPSNLGLMRVPSLSTVLARLFIAATCGFPTSVCVADEAGQLKTIDAFVQQAYEAEGLSPAKVCSEQSFVRRVYLDLLGRIPTVDEQQSFLIGESAEKREQLVNELLESSEHSVYLARTFDAILMGRNERKLPQRKQNGWFDYLESAFQSNKPWDEVASEILLARPKGDHRGHVWYLYERDDKHQDIAEAIARGFFGVDIACAQCHDHPLAIEIGQSHYWGLVSFYKRSKNTKTDQGISVSESAIGGFDRYANALDGSTDESQLVFLDREPVEEARPEDPAKVEDRDELYENADGLGKIPKFSRREKFVEQILSGHPRLARSMVNRVWALMIGRGLVHPADEMDSMHPPSHPKLLDWLAVDFADNGYDVRRLFRMIATSRIYQLDSSREGDSNLPPDPSKLLLANIKPLTAEQMMGAIQVALKLDADAMKSVASEVRESFPEVVPENDSSSLQQALYLSNDAGLNKLVMDAASGFPECEDPLELTKKLYLQIFGREPVPVELTKVAAYLESKIGVVDNGVDDRGEEVEGATLVESSRDSKAKAIAEVMWAMLTSAEFRFNH